MLPRMVQRHPHNYIFDPADPREPSDEQWEAMTPEERERALAMLPSEPDVDFFSPSEGARRLAEERAAELEAQVRELQAEIERLKRGG
jgi:hypothetical protein